MNIFVQHIYDKKRFGFANWIKYRKFLRSLSKVMPNFGMLWQMADFIKILERVYFYNNSPSAIIFSSLNFKEGENGFCINVRDFDVQIRYKLYENGEVIAIEIERRNGNKLKSNNRFVGESIDTILNDHDQNLLENVINITMSEISNLLEVYYRKKVV